MTQLNVYKMDKSTLASRKRFLDITDGNQVHKAVTAAVDSHRKDANILYRITSTKDAIYFYVSTDVLYDATFFEQYGMKYLYTINIEDVISKKEEGSVVRFSIRVLPYTRRMSSFEYINEQSGRIRWCAEKLSQHGLSVISCKESSTEPLSFKRGNKYITLTSSSFVGIASVTDKGLLLNSMTTGIGREKCFGAGLLMIA